MDANSDQSGTKNLGCLVRLFWMAIGNLILVLCIIAIAQRPTDYFGGVDVIFWCAAVALLAARYADIRYFNGKTSDGSPATMADWRRHALLIVVAATLAWLGSHALHMVG